MRFHEGIAEARKAGLLKRLRAVWAHDLTAIGRIAPSLGGTLALAADARDGK